MDPINLLSEVHKMCTVNQPICNNKVNINGCKTLPKSTEELNKLFNKIFDKFKKHNLPYGSVNNDPGCWVNIFVSIFRGKRDDSDYIEISNGCCNNLKCPIAIFYNDIADLLVNSIFNIKFLFNLPV